MSLRLKLLAALDKAPSTTLPLFQEHGFRVYIELHQLEAEGLVTSETGSPRPERGMRPATLYTITEAGRYQLRRCEYCPPRFSGMTCAACLHYVSEEK